MTEEETDLIIIKTGFNNAIYDSLKILSDLPNFAVIEDRLLRLQRAKYDDCQVYLNKLYNNDSKMGYIILEDISGVKGVALDINAKTYKNLDEETIVFIKTIAKCFWSKKFKNKEDANIIFEELLKPYSSM